MSLSKKSATPDPVVIDSTQPFSNIAAGLTFDHRPKPNAKGGAVINAMYNGGKIYIRTPMCTTWGAQEGKNYETKQPNGKWTITFQHPSASYDNAEARKMFQFMTDFEQHIISLIMSNGDGWLNDPDTITFKEAKQRLNPLLKFTCLKENGQPTKKVDLSKPPRLEVKIPGGNTGPWKTEVYDIDSTPLYTSSMYTVDNPTKVTPLTLLSVPEKTTLELRGLLEFGGMWLVNDKFSVVWNLLQCVKKNSERQSSFTTGVCMLATTTTTETTDVADSDDDNDDHDDKESSSSSSIPTETEEPAAVTEDPVSAPPPPPPSVAALPSVAASSIGVKRTADESLKKTPSEEPLKKKVVTKKIVTKAAAPPTETM